MKVNEVKKLLLESLIPISLEYNYKISFGKFALIKKEKETEKDKEVDEDDDPDGNGENGGQNPGVSGPGSPEMCFLQLGAPCVCIRLLTDSLSILLITEKEDNEAKFNQLKDIWEVIKEKNISLFLFLWVFLHLFFYVVYYLL